MLHVFSQLPVACGQSQRGSRKAVERGVAVNSLYKTAKSPELCRCLIGHPMIAKEKGPACRFIAETGGQAGSGPIPVARRRDRGADQKGRRAAPPRKNPGRQINFQVKRPKRGLPPVLIQVGSAETLLDDAVRLAGVAGAADVRVTLEVWPDMIHAWHLFYQQLAAGRCALARVGAFIRSHLG
jgi:hypothetical protein